MLAVGSCAGRRHSRRILPMSASRPPPIWMRRRISTALFTPWQVVQRPQLSSSQKARKYLQQVDDADRVIEEDDPAAAEGEESRARGSQGRCVTVEVELRHDAETTRGPPGWTPCTGPVIVHAARVLVEADVTHGAERDLDAEGPVHVAVKA